MLVRAELPIPKGVVREVLAQVVDGHRGVRLLFQEWWDAKVVKGVGFIHAYLHGHPLHEVVRIMTSTARAREERRRRRFSDQVVWEKRH